MSFSGGCCFGPGSWPCAKFTLGVVQLGLAVTMLLLLRYHLTGMAAVQQHGQLTYASTCYLASQDDWPSACTYAEVVACISMLLTFIASVLQCCATSEVSGRKQFPRYLQLSQTLLMFLGLVWWTAAASALQYHGIRADAAGLELAAYRATVNACCWGSVGLFLLMVAGELLSQKLQQQNQRAISPVTHMFDQMQSYPVLSLAAPSPTAAAAAQTVQRTATVPAGQSSNYTTMQQQRTMAQQQQQPHVPPGVVVGIPCAPAAPVPPVLSWQPPLAAVRSPALAGIRPGAYQMAMLGAGGAYQPGGQIVPVQMQLPPGWLMPRRPASAPGQIRVVNPDV